MSKSFQNLAGRLFCLPPPLVAKPPQRALRGLTLAVVLATVGGLGATANATVVQVLPPIINTLTSLGALPAGTNLNLSIGLPLRNPAALAAQLRDIYDPASPNFGHYLTPAQFTVLYGPTVKDYQAVIDFATSHGLAVTATHPNRMIVDVRGTAANIQAAFQVQMQLYQDPATGRRFYAPSVNPNIPGGLPILNISGLCNYAQPHANSHLLRQIPAAPGIAPMAAVANGGSGPQGTYLGADFRAAYLPGVSQTGSGQSVALVQFDGYYYSDITNYMALAGVSSVSLTNILLDGFSGVPSDPKGNGEVSLDIEMVISMAPGAAQILVYEGSPDNFLPNDVLNQIANDNLARQISCSWGWTGGPDPTTDQIFLQMAAQGQSFFVASGDSCAYAVGGVDNPSGFGTPSASPYVTSVGGTTLTTTGAGGSWASEKVWNWGSGEGSSGGVSLYYTIPDWQIGVSMSQNGGSPTQRNFPDVALTADNVYVIYGNGQAGAFGGTSCASPLWGSMTALINQLAASQSLPPVGFLNPSIYRVGKQAGTDYHDITTGNNLGGGNPTGYYAVSGYDLCTGWGTPANTSLLSKLAVSNPLRVYSTIVTGGNGDGIINPYECNLLSVILTNVSSVAIPGPISGTLATVTPGVVVLQNQASFPGLPPNGTVTNVVALYQIDSEGITCGSPIDFTLTAKVPNLGFDTFYFTLGTVAISNSVPQRFDNSTVLPIPDVSVVQSTNLVSGLSGPVGKITVSLWIEHTFDSDLVLTLISPDGTQVLLANQLGGGGQNYGTACADPNRTVFDDDAATSITAGSAPFVGTFQPQDSLTAFDGVGSNGPWILQVADVQSNDVGTLHCWSLFVTASTCASGTGPCTNLPFVCVTPSVDFAGQSVGSFSSPTSVLVTNCGTDVLTITNVVLAGNATDFSLAGDACLNSTIAPGDVCAVQVVFGPTTTTVPAGQLLIYGNQLNNPAVVTLTGTGITCPYQTVLPSSLPNPVWGMTYSNQLSVENGNLPVTFIRTAGDYPPGMSMTSAGLVSGVPTASGTYAFEVYAMDVAGCSASRYYTLSVNCAVITSLPAGLPVGQVGVAYAQQLSGSGGVAPYTFSQVGGSLPAGMTLSSSGLLSGSPSSIGSTFVVQVTDANGCTGQITYTLQLANPPPAIFVGPDLLNSAAVGVSYQQTLTATGGTAPNTFSVASGNLPAGVTLSSTGVLSGSPATVGSASFVVQAQDANGNVGSRAYTLAVATAVTDLGVSVTQNANSVMEGQPVTYTVTVVNYGAVTASGIQVSSSLVASNLTVATLAPGASNQWVVSLTPNFVGVLTNTAQVNCNLADTNQANNIASIQTLFLPLPTTATNVVHFQSFAQLVSATATQLVTTIVRTGDTNTTASVQYYTSDGTAQAGVNYTAGSGQVTFAPGETSQIVTVPLLVSGGKSSARMFTVNLSGASNAVVGVLGRLTVLIGSGPKAGNSFTFQDDDGDNVTVQLTGAGTLGVALTGAGSGAIESIDLNGTDGTSSLLLAVKRSATGNGLVAVGGIHATSSLRAMTLLGASLTGATVQVDGSLGSLQAGQISGARIQIAASLGSVRAVTIQNSLLTVGFTPTDESNPLAGGTFTAGATLGSVKAGSVSNSTVVATIVGKVNYVAVSVNNGGQAFGVLSGGAIGGVTVRQPSFKWNRAGAADQSVGDFHVQH